MRLSTLVTALTLALVHSANASKGRSHRKRLPFAELGLYSDATAKRLPSLSARDDITQNITAEYIELPLDHFGSDAGTFRNRYWVDMEYYKPGGPVFIFDPSQFDASTWHDWIFFHNTSFMRVLAEEFNGVSILWENRYYGGSSPVNITTATRADDLKYLKIEQSLEDVVSFAKQFSRKDVDIKLTPDHTPWVWVGGSYAGAKGAWLRNKYPDIIYATWASSATVEFTLDGSFSFEVMRKGMITKGFGNCTWDIQAAIRHIDKTIDMGDHAAAQLKEQYLGLGAGSSSNGSFADLLKLIFDEWQSRDIEGGIYGLRDFCDWMETDPETNATAPAEGWAATKGDKWASDKWAAYPNWLTMVNDDWGLECSGSLNQTGFCDLDLPADDPDDIAHTYQVYTETGTWWWANPDRPYQMVSKYSNAEDGFAACIVQFGNSSICYHLDEPATYDRLNKVLGGWNIRPSNTYFTNGDMDYWRKVSIDSDLPGAPKVEVTQEIPKCGVSPGTDKVFGYTISNATHTYDINGGNPGEVTERPKVIALFHTALREWLLCFHAKK